MKQVLGTNELQVLLAQHLQAERVESAYRPQGLVGAMLRRDHGEVPKDDGPRRGVSDCTAERAKPRQVACSCRCERELHLLVGKPRRMRQRDVRADERRDLAARIALSDGVAHDILRRRFWLCSATLLAKVIGLRVVVIGLRVVQHGLRCLFGDWVMTPANVGHRYRRSAGC